MIAIKLGICDAVVTPYCFWVVFGAVNNLVSALNKAKTCDCASEIIALFFDQARNFYVRSNMLDPSLLRQKLAETTETLRATRGFVIDAPALEALEAKRKQIQV